MLKTSFYGNNNILEGTKNWRRTALNTPPWLRALVHAHVFHEHCYWSMAKPFTHTKYVTQKISKTNDRQKPSKFTLSHARPPTRSITDAMLSFVAFCISWTRLSAPQAVSSDRLDIYRLACIWKCLDSDTDRST